MVVAAARVLCKRGAEQCNVDFDDSWKVYGDMYLEDAKAVLEAVGAPELLSELINMTARFKAAIVQGGTDEEFAEHAVAKARALISKALGQSGGTK